MRHVYTHRLKFVIALSVAVFLAMPTTAQRNSFTSTLSRSAIGTSLIDEIPGAPHSIAFTGNRDGNTDIYVMNSDGSGQTRLTENTAVDNRPDISPDGNQIVFASNRDGNFEIFVMDSDGNSDSVRQLTETTLPRTNSWPRWSPDGEWIAFQAADSNTSTNFDIYRIRPDGTGLTQVTDYPGLDQFQGWSPDGTTLAIRRDSDIYLINSTDGSNPVRLTGPNQGTSNQMASWSPDGTRIAFLSNRDGYGSVYIMNSDGSDQVNFTPRPDGRTTGWGSRAPAWSPNGEFIYFTATRSIEAGTSNEQIWVKPVAGGLETQLTSAGVNTEATVRRVVAPTIKSLSATPDVLWPANNKMVHVSLAVDVTDNSDPAPYCEITDVTSNEMALEPAWQVTGPLTLDLLAQRFGKGTGRVYIITVTCTNSSDLSSSATATVSVPHDQRILRGASLAGRLTLEVEGVVHLDILRRRPDLKTFARS